VRVRVRVTGRVCRAALMTQGDVWMATHPETVQGRGSVDVDWYAVVSTSPPLSHTWLTHRCLTAPCVTSTLLHTVFVKFSSIKIRVLKLRLKLVLAFTG